MSAFYITHPSKLSKFKPKYRCVYVYIVLISSNVSVTQWVARLARNQWMPVSREFEPHQRLPLFSRGKKLYSNSLVLVGSRNGFELDLHKQKLPVSQSN